MLVGATREAKDDIDRLFNVTEPALLHSRGNRIFRDGAGMAWTNFYAWFERKKTRERIFTTLGHLHAELCLRKGSVLLRPHFHWSVPASAKVR